MLSIIVPVLNEAQRVAPLVAHLRQHATTDTELEIILVDGGSTDRTVALAKAAGATVLPSHKGRAVQMNKGANLAKGNILYFLHADTLPPRHFDRHIVRAVKQGSTVGCFRMEFNSKDPWLRFFGWCTRLNLRICRGGDQSLFITRTTFYELGRFNEDYLVYEDNEFIGRAYKAHRFTILPQSVTTSARRYEKHPTLLLQYHYGVIHLMYYLGADATRLYRYYSAHCTS
ncbi:TIGR04283 family arsenosugar biosynthesis glycosyltransferase [Maribacter sp. 2307ULW6-5]|uniref:TIGR04283 family arsenosugar biosynthesis glycosyltransferase n=1 Tax=Maribacter sp. 2307ULW6-5 TaxID=3386275 RepID=UPI0039BD6500